MADELYTLTLTAEQRAYLLRVLGELDPADGNGMNTPLYTALVAAAASKETPRVGDRVRIPSGEEGTLYRIDTEDDDLPYSVEIAEGEYRWVSTVTVLS